jgi:hypothetical protein
VDLLPRYSRRYSTSGLTSKVLPPVLYEWTYHRMDHTHEPPVLGSRPAPRRERSHLLSVWVLFTGIVGIAGTSDLAQASRLIRAGYLVLVSSYLRLTGSWTHESPVLGSRPVPSRERSYLLGSRDTSAGAHIRHTWITSPHLLPVLGTYSHETHGL